MCGRVTLRRPDRVKMEGLDIRLLLGQVPRYNIAPTQDLWTITEGNTERVLSKMRWGLIPPWSEKPAGFINARAETLESKPSFREAFQRRRILIPADGFFEWEKLGKAKQPHYFQMKNEEPFFLAGIWDVWQRDGASITSCAIITGAPNSLLAEIHDRMPVILPDDRRDTWLRSSARVEELKEMLSPFPSAEMKGFPVGSEVNGAAVDEPGLVKPIERDREVRAGMLF